MKCVFVGKFNLYLKKKITLLLKVKKKKKKTTYCQGHPAGWQHRRSGREAQRSSGGGAWDLWLTPSRRRRGDWCRRVGPLENPGGHRRVAASESPSTSIKDSKNAGSPKKIKMSERVSEEKGLKEKRALSFRSANPASALAWAEVRKRNWKRKRVLKGVCSNAEQIGERGWDSDVFCEMSLSVCLSLSSFSLCGSLCTVFFWNLVGTLIFYS